MSDAYSILRKETNAEIADLKAKIAETESARADMNQRWAVSDWVCLAMRRQREVLQARAEKAEKRAEKAEADHSLAIREIGKIGRQLGQEQAKTDALKRELARIRDMGRPFVRKFNCPNCETRIIFTRDNYWEDAGPEK